MCLTREPLASVHLTAGKAITENSALLFQSRGAVFIFLPVPPSWPKRDAFLFLTSCGTSE